MELAKEKKTIDDLIALPDGTRAELINGEIVMMAPASSMHSKVQSEISFLAHRWVKEKTSGHSGWTILTEAWTFYEKHNSFVHDVAGFQKEKFKDKAGKGPIKVKPEWVCEVISPSNWYKDTQDVRVVLESHGVPFYWIVDPLKKEILVLKQEKRGEHYQVIRSISEHQGEIEIPPFEGISINVREIFSL